MLNEFRIHSPHSQVPLNKQREAFNLPPAGKRKVILATNIAETSITVPDVEFVIDCGRAKPTHAAHAISTLLKAGGRVSKSVV